MSDATHTEEDSEWRRPLIVVVLTAIAVLVAPLTIHPHNYIEIKSITWIIRLEVDEPFRFILTLPRILSLENYWPMYLFVFMVHRFYVGRTTLRKVLLIGLLSGLYLPIVANLGGILYLITAPWSVGHVYFDLPTFIPVLAFLLLTRILPCSNQKRRTDVDQWLNPEE